MAVKPAITNWVIEHAKSWYPTRVIRRLGTIPWSSQFEHPMGVITIAVKDLGGNNCRITVWTIVCDCRISVFKYSFAEKKKFVTRWLFLDSLNNAWQVAIQKIAVGDGDVAHFDYCDPELFERITERLK